MMKFIDNPNLPSRSVKSLICGGLNGEVIDYLEKRGIEIIKDREFRELYLGDWEGKSVAKVLEEYGDMYEKDWLANFGTFRCPSGESTLEAGERFYAECLRIASMHSGETVMITSHAAVLRAFFAKVLGIPPEEIADRLAFPSNASYSEATYENGKFTMGRFSVDDHLSDIGITKLGA